MEMLIRIVFWFACIYCYSRFVLDKKVEKKNALKNELSYIGITVYALLILTRSFSARFVSMLELNYPFQEIVSSIGMVVAYTIIHTLSKQILRERWDKWKYYFVSLNLLVYIIFYVAIGITNREIFFAIYIITYIISFVLIKYYGRNIEIPSARVWKNRLKFSLPVSLFAGISMCIYLPSELYLGNPNAFMVNYLTYIWPLAFVFFIFLVSYLAITLFLLTTSHYYICNTFCLVFTLLSNIQNMFFNGNMKSMDGVLQQWSTGRTFVNLILWVVAFGGTFILSHFVKKKVRDFFKVIGYCGVAIQLVSLIILLVMTLPKLSFDNYVLTTDNSFELSAKNNVIVFVLDWFDNQIVEQILKEDESFLEPLDGFVRYANATSKYAFTDMSVPYLLSGIEWEYDQLEAEYAKTAQKESDFLETVLGEGYTIGLYTESSYVGIDERSFVENGKYAKRSLDILDEIHVMAKMIRYKTYPFLLKKYFFYTDDDIVNMQRTDVEVHNIYNDIPFATKLLEYGITLDENREGSFKFYHLHGAHTQYLMNEKFESEETDMLTQARASLKIVYEFLEQMKENGVYENATIVITADHGQNYFDRPASAEGLGLELISSPILFVKEAEEYGISMKTSEAPVSHEELVPSLMKAITGETRGWGKAFDEIATTEERERDFIYGRHSDIPFVKYLISGNAMNSDDWSKPIDLSKE